MKQPKMRIKDLNGKDWGDKKVTSMHWKDSLLWCIIVDFMDDGNSNDYLAFYIKDKGKYISENDNLIGEIAFKIEI